MLYRKFYDGKNLLEVAILTENNINIADDFFDVGSLEYDPEKSAYKVEDCDYPGQKRTDTDAAAGFFSARRLTVPWAVAADLFHRYLRRHKE